MGKNFALRILVAIFGIPALLYVCILGGFFILGLALLLVAIGGVEISMMMKVRGYRSNLFFSLLLPMLFVIGAYYDYPVINLLALTIFVHTILIVIDYSSSPHTELSEFLGDFGGRLLPVFYVALLVSYMIWLDKSSQSGGLLLILVFLVVWATDTAAYLGGKASGKHRLAAAISPGKTWEGFFFGFIGALIAAVFSKLVFLNMSWLKVIVLALAACLFGQIGDLFESAIKRYFRVKDSSSILPGHGGVLDRFDSFLFAAPIVYMIISIW